MGKTFELFKLQLSHFDK